jgi:hypothetical protein
MQFVEHVAALTSIGVVYASCRVMAPARLLLCRAAGSAAANAAGSAAEASMLNQEEYLLVTNRCGSSSQQTPPYMYIRYTLHAARFGLNVHAQPGGVAAGKKHM